MRKRGRESADQAADGIRTRLEQASKEVLSRKKKDGNGEDDFNPWIIWIMVILAVFIAIRIAKRNASGSGPFGWVLFFLVGLIIGGVVCVLAFGLLGGIFEGLKKRRIDRYNAKIDREVANLQQEAQEKTRQVYEQTAQATEQQIAAYEAGVRQISKKILTNPNAIAPMKDFLFDRLEQAISLADADQTVSEISADLTYTVEKSGINSDFGYFDFKANQFAPLDSDMKCEALAIALGALVDHEMKTQYPNDVFHIRATQNGAEITLYFSTPNPNYIQSTAIF